MVFVGLRVWIGGFDGMNLGCWARSALGHSTVWGMGYSTICWPGGAVAQICGVAETFGDPYLRQVPLPRIPSSHDWQESAPAMLAPTKRA